MKALQTDVIINAPVSRVWEVLTDFPAYADWNPFIHISGKPKEGTQLINRMFLEGQKPQTFKPKVLVAKPEQEFRWLGSMFVKGIFDGEHYFLLEPISDNQTRVIHGEKFGGILRGLIMRMVGDATRTGFKTMNQALKERAEKK